RENDLICCHNIVQSTTSSTPKSYPLNNDILNKYLNAFDKDINVFIY
ncbi:19807_t:CDS:1, partial [Cetraspora pellucida]